MNKGEINYERIVNKHEMEFVAIGSFYLIAKLRYSAFFHTELNLILRRLGINTVVLIGTTTPNCIRTTCYDGIFLEYNVVILSDCTSSQTEEIQQSNLRDMKNVGAQIITAEEFISGKKLTDTVTKTQEAVLGDSLNIQINAKTGEFHCGD